MTGDLEGGWRYDDEPLNLTLTLARNPRLLRRFSVFAGLFLMRSELSPREQELLALRSAILADSEYIFGHHVQAALEAGVSRDEIATTALNGGQWTDREALLNTAAEELLRDGSISDLTWEAMVEELDPSQILEVVMAPGFYRMVANFVRIVGVAPEPRLPGWPEADRSLGTPQAP